MRHSTAHGTEVDDRRSVLSASSLGSAGSADAKHSIHNAQQQGHSKNRRFAAAIGKVGYAKEAREAVSKLINMRVPPISEPLDYESFITEFNAELESDALRELLLFPRDDIALCKPCKNELDAVEKVAKYYEGITHWGFARDALQYFTSPSCLIKFNYENYFGDCEKYIASSGLEELVFEEAEPTENTKDNGNVPQVGILKEGYLLVDLHGESFVRNFKARKRRYCVIRRNAEQQIIVEIYKQANSTANKSFFAIKSALLKTSNKQRTTILELIPMSGVGQPPVQCLLMPSDLEIDVKTWFIVVDQALKETESTSEKTSEPSLNEVINESVSDAFQLSRRPSNTVESLLRPPVLKRKNLFYLYENVEPMCRPSGEPSALLEEQENEPFKVCNSSGHLAVGDAEAAGVGASSDVDLRNCHSVYEDLVNISVRSDQFHLTIRCDEVVEQIEPFFLHVFLFDLQSGQRISEELPITITTNEYAQKISTDSSNGRYKTCIFGVNNYSWRASFKLPQVTSDVYLVFRIERLFSSCPIEIYNKSHLDRRSLTKNSKLISAACKRLSDYRTLFAWTARPLQSANMGLFTNDKNELPIYIKSEGHLTDLDLKRHLTDFPKLQKSGKIVSIPGALMTVVVKLTAETVELPLKDVNPCIATNFYRNLSDPTIQVEHLPSTINSKPKMLHSCNNWLYIYPLSLIYGSQKSFSRARNLGLTVTFVRLNDGRHETCAKLLDLSAINGPFVASQNCALQYHEQNPMFADELKLELPLDLREGDHLLFSFTHISLSTAQKLQSSESVEQAVGHTWIPLVNEGGGLVLSEDSQEFELPVASALTPDYCSVNPIAVANRKNNESSIKWVDNGKPLFRLRLRLHSALFTSNGKLNQFFQNCWQNPDDLDWLLETNESPFDGIPFAQLLPHLPIVFNRVLQLFTKTGILGFSGRVLKILVQLADLCIENGHKLELREFIRFHCAVGGEFDANARALYEGILEGVDAMLAENTDQSIVLLIIKNLWFVLDICAKSMTQAILINGAHKYSRRRRFSNFTIEALESTFTAVTQQILNHHQRFPAETRIANLALAYFAKHTLNLADRGVVFKVVYETVKRYDLYEMGLPRRFKLELLQILASHEHWVPLNLPIVFNSSNKPIMNVTGLQNGDQTSVGADALRVAKSSLRTTNILSRLFSQFLPSPFSSGNSSKKSTLNIEHFQLSRTYCKTHFLVGLLIQEFGMALRESRTYRRLVITLVRNLICKHGGDGRYDSATAQSRIAVLYAPLIRVILENIGEFESLGYEFKENNTIVENTQKKFDYPQMSARSIVSKEVTTQQSKRATTNGTTQKIASFAEKLDFDETKDLLLCCLYLLNNLPKSVIIALCFNSSTSESLPVPSISNGNSFTFPIIPLLKLALRLFRSNDANTTKPITTKKTSLTIRDAKVASHFDRSARQARKPTIQEAHFGQEASLIVLDVAHVLDEHLASRWNASDFDETQERQMFNGLIQLKLELVGDEWPENVRLNALNSLGMFIEMFASQLSTNDGADAMMCRLRLERVQAASAALLHLLIRQGFNNTIDHYLKQMEQLNRDSTVTNSSQITAELLGNSGVQITTALAHLLGQNELSADCPRFQHGLNLFESLTSGTVGRKMELFSLAAKDLTHQLRDILKATISISAARNDPVLLADLHVQLANNYRASPALRIAWFETLAQIHITERWFAEAAVCQAHCVAIIAKQLSLRGLLEVDFSLLDKISQTVAVEENTHGVELPMVQGSNFTLEALTNKVEETMKTLIQSERYEAIGPLCRLAIPIYEKQSNHRALMAIYSDLLQVSSRAAEIEQSGKRHLGSYYRVVLFSPLHFRDDHKAEFVYREPGLTSLAEACDFMVKLFRRALNTEHVRFLTEHEVEPNNLDPAIAHLQITHVEPLSCITANQAPTEGEFEAHLMRMQLPEMNFVAHTNVRQFYYEKPFIEPQPTDSNEKVAEQARLWLKRVFLTTEESFPSTRRRLRIVSSNISTLNPLMLACENLHRKAAQIQRILSNSGISPSGPLDRCKLNLLDIKGLQCLLQGSVSPTVNVGVLAYAEAFTSEAQRTKYGPEGLDKLKDAFRVFMAQLARALAVNEAAIGQDQSEYQEMMKNSFDGMVERLSTFFDNESFLPDQYSTSPNSVSTHSTVNPTSTDTTGARNSTYILDSISGLQRP
ncbi:hypothetical protein M3Y94_00757800 [Aphelenchoides besseyi]|nr:hypothetical protein M3Y94_00757800 [Aphelenchoides besseyi]